MSNFLVHELHCARHARLIAAAYSEGIVQIWDASTRELVLERQTEWALGGRRLFLNDHGSMFLAAAWRSGRNGGITAYSVPTGSIVWKNTTLSEIQRIVRAKQPDCAWIITDSAGAFRLDTSSGEIIEEVRGVTKLYEDYGDVRLIVSRRRAVSLLAGNRTLVLPAEQKVLTACVGRQRVFISEMGSTFRCFNFQGVEEWRFDPGKGSHITHVWSDDRVEHVYAFARNFDKPPVAGTLLVFDPESGEVRVMRDGMDTIVAASVVNDYIVTMCGDLYKLSNGFYLGKLNFKATRS